MPTLNRSCLALLLAATGFLLSAEQRPACNSLTLGQLWPSVAEQDARAAHRLARCGQLLICTRGSWRYRWRPLAVRVDQLQKGVKPQPPAACQEPALPGADTVTAP
ncbi:MAG: hypothetical protein FJW34_05130 [Acidobacteria bacterium]|nr:hypothetical protein [Acidobacteriota bacterium]